ncbi:hypothetical protein LWE61_08150 [Sphingobium sufflavum]|uniref:hypothetical protein n=1 Tax=Sphingobium sufflavum TaxID=1129547 RepID=UPI001F2A8287|nr:hypothetical protein [Sphingobium sufflavum]MCE7796533.1 hypothetical protein [Sphingobium sufflavum]
MSSIPMNGSLAVPPVPLSKIGKIAWNWRHNPNIEQWLAWYAIVVFYNIFGVVFFLITRTQPPPKAWWDLPKIMWWFNENHFGLLFGFGIMFLIGALSIASTALICYSMRRMSVSPVFANIYLIIYSLAAVPGMLLTCIALVVGALRPDRDPKLIGLLYDMGFLSFSGTMGIFLIGSVIWAVAILLDKNSILPKWFGYFNICNALTEVVVATCCIMKEGPFAWNGMIAFNINMVVFGIYTGCFITLLKTMIEKQDQEKLPLPDLR